MRPVCGLRLAAGLALVTACSGSPATTGSPPTPSADVSPGTVSAVRSSDATPLPSMSPGTATVAPSREAPSAAGHRQVVDVAIRDFAFHPEAVEAATGETIRWTNEDGEPHTVRSTDGSFSSAIIAGTPFEWQVEGTPGTEIPYICSIHAQMEGMVKVSG